MTTPRSAPSVLLTFGWGLGTPSGVARHVQELARHLALAGARVTVLSVSSAGYPRFPRPALPSELEGHAVERELAEVGVDVVRVPPHPLHWTLDGRRVRAAVERLLDERALDAVLGFYHEAACLPALLSARGVRFGLVATWLSYRMALGRAGGGPRGLLRRASNRRLVVAPYRAAEVLFASSEFTRGELVDVLGCDPARIRVTPLGVRASFHLINMAVNLNLIPAKGMTLPFISYGGSSMIGIAFGMGLLLAFTRRSAEARHALSARSLPAAAGAA
jgi:glycosyltransferase involved in cell wall biosynthesis